MDLSKWGNLFIYWSLLVIKYFKTKSLKVTVCCDGMAPETIDITLDNIDSFYFECLTTYVETNEEKILNNKKNAEEISAKIRKERKGKKDEK